MVCSTVFPFPEPMYTFAPQLAIRHGPRTTNEPALLENHQIPHSGCRMAAFHLRRIDMLPAMLYNFRTSPLIIVLNLPKV